MRYFKFPTKRKIFAAMILGAVTVAAVIAILLMSSVMTPQETICLRIVAPFLTYEVKAVILDDEVERVCGLKCVNDISIRAAVFVWRGETPKVVTFSAEGLDRRIHLAHMVYGKVAAVYTLNPGARITVVSWTRDDYFIEVYEDLNVGQPISFSWCAS